MKRILLLSLFSFVVAFVATAQRTVSGTVTDDSGETVPGVNVVLKGTTTGTTTDLDGNYRLSVPEEGGTLVFSFIGLASQEVEIGARSAIDVAMASDVQQLTEVIVTGYNNTSKAKLTSAISSVDGAQIESIPMPDVNQLIQGRAPGVYSTAPSGQPGAAQNIRIRGTGSITAGRGPLYVIDGIPVQSGDFTSATETADVLSNINPNDIASLTVLKDAAATALYGSRGGNGVILITTKKGKAGDTKITARAQYGITKPQFGNFQMMSAQQAWDYERTILANSGQNEAQIDANRPSQMLDSTFNWVDAAFRTGKTQNYEVQATGGDESTRYFVSGSYFQQDGTLIESSFSRVSARANLDKRFRDNIDFSLNSNVSYTDQLNAVAGNRFASPLLAAFVNTPLQSPYNPNTGQLYTGQEPEFAIFTGDNFLYSTPINPVTTNTLRTLGKGVLAWDILDNLRVSQTGAVDFVSIKENSFQDPTTNDGFDNNGDITNDYNENITVTSQTQISGDWKIGNDHTFDALAVYEFQKNRRENFSAYGVGLASGKLKTLQSTAVPQGVDGFVNEFAFESVLGQLNYNYLNRYYFTGSVRRDGSSRFGAENRYATFWAVAGSWRLIEEGFMQPQNILTDAKLRVSYGTSGNASIGNYASLGLYGFGVAYNGLPGSAPSQIANPDLTWETSTTLNIGIDLGFVKNRVLLGAELYNKISENLLLDVPVSRTSGFTTATRNIGELRNRGIELTLSTVNLEGELKWTTDFNIAYNENEILSLPDGEDIDNGNQVWREGKPIRTWEIQKWAGVNPADGTPLWFTEDGGVTGNYANAGLFEVGNATPDYIGGLSNTLSYKGLTLNVFFNFALGHEIFNSSRRFIESDGQRFGWNHLEVAGEDYWTAPGDIVSRPQPRLGGNNQANSISTRYLEDGSFVRLRNVNLSYTLPKNVISKVGMSNARIFVQGQNLLTFTNYSGFDPEAEEDGDEFFRYPVGRAYTAGIEISF
ncbi:SusC/RagA family TonB-linked outer membrane protein [Marinoscillum pacificum]|uniref:SusC/RagA family TonB-linked outer membrane protein n=1 Tax=Marinoscillum pacificum TaxID=392723 RepID=UPI0021570E85|nr:TonB-dependent receptor [Marinoscillum pacificum]